MFSDQNDVENLTFDRRLMDRNSKDKRIVEEKEIKHNDL